MTGKTGPGPGWVLFVDGGSRGNPGISGAGAVLYSPGGKRARAMHWSLGHGTNNEAEYEGLIRGMEMALEAGADSLEVRSDSELMVKQMCGEYRVKAAHLKEAVARARGIAGRFSALRFTAIPREGNREADRLANQAMDEAGQGAGGSRREEG